MIGWARGDVLPQTERVARTLLGRTKGKNTVDALVAAEAIVAGADLLTGDPADMRALLAEHPKVAILAL